MMEDPYKVLGVSRDASDDEIKRAYRRLAKEYHPDRNPGDAAAAQKMQQINAAYEQIKNPEKAQPAGGYNPYGNYGYGDQSRHAPGDDYQQAAYQQPAYQQPVYQQPAAPVVPGKGMSLTAMVLGIISLVFCCVWYISIPCAIVGLILGCIGNSKAKEVGMKSGMAVAGIVCSAIAIGLTLLLLLIAGAALASMM